LWRFNKEYGPTTRLPRQGQKRKDTTTTVAVAENESLTEALIDCLSVTFWAKKKSVEVVDDDVVL
jgi:hypothetical protein